ncbi:MAG: haloacid dehalogenase [Alphaproteobacteria bacterium]|nr:MAG: haloacid dehalogenase [Alphaproteobacteria bacterium]
MNAIRALSFDCYGTLIDWETGILEALGPRFTDVVMDDVLLHAFAQAESAVEQAHPHWRYPRVLAEVHRRLSSQFGLKPDAGKAQAFAASVGDWPPFADSTPMLRELKSHFALFVLSNVDMESFTRTQRRLGVDFDGVYTAEEIGVYKPDPQAFAFLLARLAEHDVHRHQFIHIAQSLYHDIAPAAEMGLTTCWLDRRRGRQGGAARTPAAMPTYDWRHQDLRQLVDHLTCYC